MKRVFAFVSIVVASIACARIGACDPPATSCTAEKTERYIAQSRGSYRRAIESATNWLAALSVDPVELRRRGHKGKKHFVEAIDTYGRLIEIATPAEKPILIERLKKLTAITNDDAYHDMLTNDDQAFKQDATSYLRAALLMERLGLETTRYRKEIKSIEGRLNAHMKTRGVHQRMVFSWYYRHFGLTEPFPLASAYEKGVIASRLPVDKIDRKRAYDLTHEIFAPYEYGDNLSADPFDIDEKRYLHEVLAALVSRQIARKDPDLVAELISCMRFLRFMNLDEYGDGLAFLLLSQNPNGSWGSYERGRKRAGELVEQAYILHTTTVAVDALSVAFHDPWNTGVKPWCPPVAGARAPAPASAVNVGAASLGDDEDATPAEP